MNYLECAMCDYIAPHSEGNTDGDFYCSDACWLKYLETLVPNDDAS